MLVSNAKEIATYSYSFWMSLLTALVSAIGSSLPLWDPTQVWFSTTNLICIFSLLFSVGGAGLRLVNQNLGKKTDEDEQLGLGI